MIPANAGEATEVPPYPCRSSRLQIPVTSDRQMTYKLPTKPLLANRETSGRSRTLSFGTPAPLCHVGLAYPCVQVPTCWPFTTQLLFPPLPPTEFMAPFSEARELLQMASVVVPQFRVLNKGLVQESSQVVSGI